MSIPLHALAAKLRRPADTWPSLAGLPPDRIGVLAEAIDRAAARQANALETALRRALSPWLARIVLARLRRRRP